MSEHRDTISYVSQCVFKLISGSLGEDELSKLEAILIQDETARRHYYELNYLIVAMKNTEGILGLEEVLSPDMDVLQDMAEYEKTAPAVEELHGMPPRELIRKVVYPPREKRKISRFGMVFLAMNAAAILFLLLFLRFALPEGGSDVAILTDSLNAKWADAEGRMVNGASLVSGGKSLLLREGYAELLFNNQSRVTLEGPAEFQIPAEDQIKLIYGRLYARVPQEAIGFTVKTPSAQIVDLGTEFGVECDLQSSTSLHVVKGKTVLIAGDKSNKGSVEVTEGGAKKVSAVTRTISDISCNDRLFARKIDSAGQFVWRGETEISLADMVGGGNGLGTGTLDSGIETNTGRWFESPDPALVQGKVTGILSGGGVYNKVSSLALIDGVFVPDSRRGAVQVTSAGHTFDGFVDGGGVFWGNIFNGAWHASDTSIMHPLKLNGRTYGNPDRPAISLHSSQGITFDLQAVRQTIPGGRILRFTSLFGVSETVAQDPLFGPTPTGVNMGKVNCWVLVDGRERLNLNAVTYLQGAAEIDIELHDEDRFLTLAVTESDDRRAYDWALFARPTLQIEMNAD